jgi:thimet oligopeptidase
MQTIRSLYDIQIHGQAVGTPVSPHHLAQLHRDMVLKYLDIELPDDTIFAAGWSHMADYDAGYYGYLWSKVYAADMFTRFASNPLDITVGHAYREKVLAPGSSKKEQLLVEDFLGRPSTNAAFLAELGIS